jgi:hypothetical protein
MTTIFLTECQGAFVLLAAAALFVISLEIFYRVVAK